MATTELSVMATPGKPHSFLAKTEAEVVVTGGAKSRVFVFREDEEILGVIIEAFKTGIFE